MFNNTKLFAYFYIQLVFVNFVYKKCYLQVKQEDIMDIGNKLKELRVLKGLTQEELAEKIDITPANLSILKTGKAKAIRFSTLEAICKELDCQPGDILEFKEG